jgi:hypothetical protein
VTSLEGDPQHDPHHPIFGMDSRRPGRPCEATPRAIVPTPRWQGEDVSSIAEFRHIFVGAESQKVPWTVVGRRRSKKLTHLRPKKLTQQVRRDAYRVGSIGSTCDE